MPATKKKPKPLFVLIDEANGGYSGPFKTEKAAKLYAKLNDWGPAEGVGGRFGQGWNVQPLDPPGESEDESYNLVLTL